MKTVKDVFAAERIFCANGISIKSKNIYLVDYRIYKGFLTSQESNVMYFLLWQGIDAQGRKFYLRADNGEILDLVAMEAMVYKNHSLRSLLSPVYSGTVAKFPDGTIYTISREIIEMQKSHKEAKVFLWEGISSIPASPSNCRKLIVPAA